MEPISACDQCVGSELSYNNIVYVLVPLLSETDRESFGIAERQPVRTSRSACPSRSISPPGITSSSQACRTSSACVVSPLMIPEVWADGARLGVRRDGDQSL